MKWRKFSNVVGWLDCGDQEILSLNLMEQHENFLSNTIAL